jgi:NAD(P)H-dependent FMN reductase
MEPFKIKVIIGSTRKGRFGEQPARWIYGEAVKRKELSVELLDLRDYPMPFFDEPVSPSMAKEPYKNAAVSRWSQKIRDADGFIIVTPEYNHGYPGVLKNALDYLYYEWNKKPVGFVSYGTVGGARSVEQLREVAVELQMVPLRYAVQIVNFWSELDEKGNLKTEKFKETADNLLSQLAWWAKVLKPVRETDKK